jgi:regulator of replication initiation timing
MNVKTQTTKLKELTILEKQIAKTISDIGRFSSYNQSTAEVNSRIKLEKMSLLRTLKEKKTNLIKRMEKHSESAI